MPATAVSRKVIRDELVGKLTPPLTGTGPYQQVLNYDKRDFDGKTPILMVLSVGTQRDPFGINTDKYRTFFRFNLLSFILNKPITKDGYTEQDIEDTLDLCEKELVDAIKDNRRNVGFWESLYLEVDESSEVIPANVGGEPYLMETVIVIAEAHDA